MKDLRILKPPVFFAVFLVLSALASCKEEGSHESHFIYFGTNEPYTRIGAVEFQIDSYAGTIHNTEQMPASTDVSALTAWFVTNHDNEGVFVQGVRQISGMTVNDFTNPVVYEVRTKSETRTYTVTIDASRTCNTQAGARLEAYTDLVASVDSDESWWLSPYVRISQVEFTTVTAPARSLRLCLLEADNSDESIVVRPTMPYNGDEWGLQDMMAQAQAARDAGYNVIAAINGDVFGPTGEPVGIVCRDGNYLKVTFDDEVNGSFFGIRNDGKASLGNYTEFLAVKDKLIDGIGAAQKLVIGGGTVIQTDVSMDSRTAAGMDEDDLKTIYMVVVEGLEGANPDDPKGITLTELANCMKALGVGHAVNLDGGASSTFLVRDESGGFTALNRPGGQLEKVANGLAVVSK